MTTVHAMTASGTCPHGGADDYIVEVFPPDNTVLFAEKVTQYVDSLLRQPIYQEEFTVRLANQLRCRVRTKCGHVGGRVQTTCEAAPGDPAPGRS